MPCSVPGCPNLVERGRCCAHERPRSRASQWWWSRQRKRALRRDHGRCVCCCAKATIVHHVQPLSEGGTDDLANLESLCAVCHDERHVTQAGPRGRLRAALTLAR